MNEKGIPEHQEGGDIVGVSTIANMIAPKSSNSFRVIYLYITLVYSSRLSPSGSSQSHIYIQFAQRSGCTKPTFSPMLHAGPCFRAAGAA